MRTILGRASRRSGGSRSDSGCVAARVCERSFGLMISSIEKLISDSAAPNRAIDQAGRDEPPPGAEPEGEPVLRVEEHRAPGRTSSDAPRPRNDRPASPRIAKITAKTNCEASSGSRFGRISTSR